MVLRQLLFGEKRFDQMVESLEIGRAVLSARLKRLETEGIVERRRYEERPPRYEYHLTDKGIALWDVMAAMWRFGDDWMYSESPGSKLVLLDKSTGKVVQPKVVDENTGEPLELSTTRLVRRRGSSKSCVV
jgi:DNA-binding HxlR family transcriptional regulator